MAGSTATEKGHTPPALGCPKDAPPDLSLCSTSINRDATGARIIVVMGVSGTGKSTLGMALSRALHVPFIDGDDLHPAANVAKMSRGEPLDDVDRQPWLETIREMAVACVLGQVGLGDSERVEVAEEPSGHEGTVRRAGGMRMGGRPGVIVACSSLKKTYRAVLRGKGVRMETETAGSTLDAMSLPTYFVYLKGDRDVLMARMLNRQGHFMKAGMLTSQLDTLESPEDEPGVVTVSVDMSTEEQVQRVVEMLGSTGSSSSP